jgi:preprotein translocase subunit YajC
MTGITSAVLLQAEGAPAGPDYSFFLMMGMIFLIFYMLVMRPQQRQQKEKDQAIKGAVKGDRVITAGGLHGMVTKVADDFLTVEIARVKGGASVEVEVARARIDSVEKPGKKEGGEGS